ncbi:hypothetical protein [Flavobacterium sp. J27]|uniref:hypothetical protein n=1 Tax=Flavobacterium sp. J27 TaxID=2060419 RepID=UPI00103203BE|nr:hypothetical protein [Flavobacterium sp. J27]
MNTTIREKIRNGFNLDLGKLIEDCFEIYKKIFLIGGLGFLLVSIFGILFYGFLVAMLYGVSDIAEWAMKMEAMQHEIRFIIGNIIMTVFFAALIAPLNAGFLKLCFLSKRNQELKLGVVFDYYKSKYLKDIIIGSVIIALTSTTFISAIKVFPFSSFTIFLNLIGVLIQILVSLFTILFIPLVIFGNQNYTDAIQNSIKLTAKKPFHIILALVIAVIGAFLGLIGFCIGVFFTMPLYVAMIFSIYDNIVGVEEYNVLDEIGRNEE